MEIAKIKINGADATVSDLKTITSGMVGATVSIEYDSTWDGLNKQVVIKTPLCVMNADGTTIPHELLKLKGVVVSVGVYGYTDDGTIAIPTVYAELGRVQPGADPEGDPATKPTLPVWARMQNQINGIADKVGNLENALGTGLAELDALIGGDG